MINLPDELIREVLACLVQQAFDSNDSEDLPLSPLELGAHPDELFLKVSMHSEKDVVDANYRKSVYNLSLVNHRLRGICLQILFERVDFVLRPMSSKVEEMYYFHRVLGRNLHLTHLIRHARLICTDNDGEYTDFANYDPYTHNQFITDILDRCPKLERLDIPWAHFIPRLTPLIPAIEAINSHPSSDLRVIFPEAFQGPGDLNLLELPSTFLSRVVFNQLHYDNRRINSEYIQSLIQKLGLRVLKAHFSKGDRHRTTYPDLIHVQNWTLSTGISLQEFTDFLERHPSLMLIHLDWDSGREMTPWGAKLMTSMYPHQCTIIPGSMIARRDARVGWHLSKVNVSLKLAFSESISDAILKMGAALPGVRDLTFMLEEDSRLGRKLNTETLIELMRTSFPNLTYVLIPQFMSDAIFYECHSTFDDPWPADDVLCYPFEWVEPFCQTFFENLARSLPSLSKITFPIPRNSGFRKGGRVAKYINASVRRNGDEVGVTITE